MNEYKAVMSSGYYVSSKRKLLTDFDRAAGRVRGIFVNRYGRELADTMIGEARLEYEGLIAELPYIGGKQPFTRFIVATAWFLAMYRVLKARGRPLEEAGRIVYELTEKTIYGYPWFVRRYVGWLFFSKRNIKRLMKGAAESQRRDYAGDYVYTFVEGDGTEFDFGIDYADCATCKFLNQQNAPELARYVCLVDEIYSEAFGWGLARTMTIAEGFERCDFRFKKGDKTRIDSPIPRADWPTRFKSPQSLSSHTP
jgi:hypothetical protein